MTRSPIQRLALTFVVAFAGFAGAQELPVGCSSSDVASGVDHAPAALIPEFFGDWMMWWSTNREDFFTPINPAAASRPAYSGDVKIVTADGCRAEIIPVLLSALKDGDRQVREAAAISLGMCGDGRDVAALITVLGDKDRAVVEAAIMGLGMLGVANADEALAKVLADPSEGERKRGLAALALGLSGSDAAQKPLMDGLGTGKSDKLESCRMVGSGLWTGADIGEDKSDRRTLAWTAIQKALTNQDSKRRKMLSMGVAALSRVRDPASLPFILNALQDPRFDVRAAAAIAAGRVIRPDDKAHVRTLIKALETEGHTLPRRFIMVSLGRLGGPEVIPVLAKELDSGDKTRRAFGALSLGIAGALDVAPRLRQELTGATEDRLKGAFAVALGLMKDPKAFGSVAQVVQSKTNDELLSYCVWFFALIRNPDGRPILEKILSQSRVPDTLEAAATAIGVLGAAESLPFLTQLLSSKAQDTMRKAAAIGLGRMRDQRGVEPLLKAARADDAPVVRAAAIAALGAVARRTDRPPFARVAIDAYYGLQNEAIDEIATRAGSLMKTTEEGGTQRTR